LFLLRTIVIVVIAHFLYCTLFSYLAIQLQVCNKLKCSVFIFPYNFGQKVPASISSTNYLDPRTVSGI